MTRNRLAGIVKSLMNIEPPTSIHLAGSRRFGLGRWFCFFIAPLSAGILAGCGSPNQANIQLRKDKQQLEQTVEQLQRQHDADAASLAVYEKANASTTKPVLSQAELSRLFTVHGITLGRLTGSYDSEGSNNDSGLKVYVETIDDDGDTIKAAGAFRIEAVDLAGKDPVRIGEWNFTVQDARSSFYNHVSLYTYVLHCPWQTKPVHDELTVRVTFTDELTKREFTAQRVAKINLPKPATQP